MVSTIISLIGQDQEERRKLSKQSHNATRPNTVLVSIPTLKCLLLVQYHSAVWIHRFWLELQRLPLTRALEGYFSLLKPKMSWAVSMVFLLAPTEKVPSSLKKAGRLSRIISRDNVVFNYFIKMKDYIVKAARSLRAEWNSRNTLYSLRKGF